MAGSGLVQSGFCWLSAPGASALSLLLLHGPIVRHSGSGTVPATGDHPRPLGGYALRQIVDNAADQPRHGWLIAGDGAPIDEVMFARVWGGVLVTCHGGAAVRRAVESELAAAGFFSAPATPWGRTRFEVETLGLLPEAQGRLGAATILHARAEQLAVFLAMPREQAAAVLRGNEQTRWLLNPPRVQLWGPVNSGKSSLLNALCGEELAAVADEPGLTRDVIEGRFEHEGFVVRVFDAPGVMAAAHGIDRAAIELAEQWKAQADLVINLQPGAPPPGEWVLASRIDESGGEGVSVRMPETLRALKHRITGHFIGKLLALPAEQRFALHPELRDDLRSWLAGKVSAGEVQDRWLVE